MNTIREFSGDPNQRKNEKGESNSYQQYPFNQEINAINRLFLSAMDELKTTTLLAHSLAESSLKALDLDELISNPKSLDSITLVRWEKYTNEINQILDKFGTNLQGILNQKIGQEVLEEIVEKYKTRIRKLTERRQ